MILLRILLWFTAGFFQGIQGFQEETFGFLSHVGQVNLVTSMSTAQYTFGYSCSKANSFDATISILDKIEKTINSPPFTYTEAFSIDNDLSLMNIAASIRRQMIISRTNILTVEKLLSEYQSFGMEVTNKTNANTIDKADFGNIDFKKMKGLGKFLAKQTLENITVDSKGENVLMNTAIALDYSIASSNEALIKLVHLLEDVTHVELSQASEDILVSMVNFDKYAVIQADITGLIVENYEIYFTIEVVYGHTFEQYNKHKSIPHFGHVIDGQFASNQTHIMAISCSRKYCIPDNQDICAIALVDENVDEVFSACSFVKTDKAFEFSTIGIFIYQTPIGDLKQYIDTQGLTIEVLPSLFTFKGCLKLKIDGLIRKVCYNDNPQIIPSRLIDTGLDNLLNPTFVSEFLGNISNVPLLITICSLIILLNSLQYIGKVTIKKLKKKYYCKDLKINHKIKISNNRDFNSRANVSAELKVNRESGKNTAQEEVALISKRISNSLKDPKTSSRVKDTIPIAHQFSSSTRQRIHNK